MKNLKSLKRNDPIYSEIETLCHSAGYDSVEEWAALNESEDWPIRKVLDRLAALTVHRNGEGMKIIAIMVLMFFTASAFAQVPTSNDVARAAVSNDVKKAEKKIDPATVKSFAGKVKSKEGGNLVVVLNDSQGIHGIGAQGYSLVNQGPGKPKKARDTRSEEQRKRERAREEKENTYTLVGHPDITRVMIGSTITFKGVAKDKKIEWVE